jgi:hypothetical protein
MAQCASRATSGTRLERRVAFVRVAAPGTPDEEIDAMAERL